MTPWHRLRSADAGLRLFGLVLCAISYLAIVRLVELPAPARAAGGLAFGLATVGFVCASAGGVMLTLGHHLFDEIEVSERWRPQPICTPHASVEERPNMKDSDHDMMIVGRDVDGSWTVRGSGGELIGSFPSSHAAQRFAFLRRREHPSLSIASSAGMHARLPGRLSLGPMHARKRDPQIA